MRLLPSLFSQRDDVNRRYVISLDNENLLQNYYLVRVDPLHNSCYLRTTKADDRPGKPTSHMPHVSEDPS